MQVPSFISTAYTGTDTSRGGSEMGDVQTPATKEPLVKEETQGESNGDAIVLASSRKEEV